MFKKINYTAWIRGHKYVVKQADKATGIYKLELRRKKFTLRMGSLSHELEDEAGTVQKVLVVSFNVLNVRSRKYRRDKPLVT